MKKLLSLALIPALLLGCGEEKAPSSQPEATKPAAVASVESVKAQAQDEKVTRVNSFTNPIYPNGADPWLEYYDGNYYLTTTTWTSQLVMRKAPTLDALATATPVNIWSETDLGRCCNFWAFEFHRLKGPNGYRWYVIYTSGISENFDRQHLSVIESHGDDPMGPYTYKGSPMPDTWNIDGNYFEHNGKLYLLYSQWHGDEQVNLITEMENPWTVKGEPIVVTRPEYDWEFSGRKVNEGAEILKRDGRTFLVYSGSFCNTPDYKLGLVELIGDDPMVASNWKKFPEPVFSKANGVYGPGHNGFFKSPDGTEDWLIYHANASELEGCHTTRSLRAQKFTWTDDGLPFFGEPVAAGEKVISPSGENGPLVTRVHGTRVKVVSKANNQCLTVSEQGASFNSCDTKDAEWTLDYTAHGKYRLVNNKNLFLGDASSGKTHCATGGTGLHTSPWFNQHCQEWSINAEFDGWVSLQNSDSEKPLQLSACVEPTKPEAEKDINDIPVLDEIKPDCQQWRIEPAGDIALSSVQSGKVLSLGKTQAVQDEWHNRDDQRWTFKPSSEGYFHMTTKNGNGQCLTVERGSVVPGTAAVFGNCEGPQSEWYIAYLKDGTQAIHNRKSKLVLDIANCSLSNGATIAQTQWFDINCQKYQLKSPE